MQQIGNTIEVKVRPDYNSNNITIQKGIVLNVIGNCMEVYIPELDRLTVINKHERNKL